MTNKYILDKTIKRKQTKTLDERKNNHYYHNYDVRPFRNTSTQFNRPSLRETTKNGKAKMADMYETYIDGSYYIRVNYWQNNKFFCCL